MSYDGSLVKSSINSDSYLSDSIVVENVDSYQSLKIGLEEIATGSQNYIAGDIDDVVICNQKLTNNEIVVLKNNETIRSIKQLNYIIIHKRFTLTHVMTIL